MGTSSSATRTAKCSKSAGEFCRLHNPAPALKHSFSSVDDIFNTAASEIGKLEAKQAPPVPLAGVSFQRPDEPRVLAQNIPAKIADHVTQNEKDLAHLSDIQRVALRGFTGFAAGTCSMVLRGKEYDYYDKAPLWRETQSPCDFVSKEDLADYMKTMDEVLSPRLEEPRIVYRGIPIYSELREEIGNSIGKDLSPEDTAGLVEGFKEYYKVGKVFDNPGYVSTSSSAYVAAQRTSRASKDRDEYYLDREIRGIQFELKTNAGLDITSAANIPYRREREVVLPRGTRFKVTNVYTKPESYDTISGYNDRRRPDELTTEKFTGIGVIVQMVEVDSNGDEITHTNPHKPTVSIDSILLK